MGAAGLKPGVQACAFRSEDQGGRECPVELPVRNRLEQPLRVRHQGCHHLNLLEHQLLQLLLHLFNGLLTIRSKAMVRKLEQASRGCP